MAVLSGLIHGGRAVVRRLVRRSDSNFKFAFLFLDAHQRAGLEDVYRFCRIVDDIVDERPPGAQGEAWAHDGLQAWRVEVARIYGVAPSPSSSTGATPSPQRGSELGPSRCPPPARPDPVFSAQLSASIKRYGLQREHFDAIIEGCAMDLERDRYRDAPELELYCYRVASCVGLLCIRIFGDSSDAAHVYARHLGLALQYTNILRDVAEDIQRGRIYLPATLLERHGVGEQDLVESRYDARFIAMAEEFASWAEDEYRAAAKAFAAVARPRALVPAEIMGRTYYAILQELRRVRFDVFSHRPSLRRRDKLRAAAGSVLHATIPFLPLLPSPATHEGAARVSPPSSFGAATTETATRDELDHGEAPEGGDDDVRVGAG